MNLLIEFKREDGTPITVLVAAPKNFKTGSRGFYCNGKIEIDGKRYQTQVQLVEIGSKNAPVEEKADDAAE